VPPAPSRPDDRRPAPAVAGQLLDLLLGGELRIPGGPQPLVRTWLDAANASGYRPDERHLVDLLQLGTSAAEHREAVAAAVGPRGRWLAAQHPPWAWALSTNAADRGPRSDGPLDRDTPTDAGDGDGGHPTGRADGEAALAELAHRYEALPRAARGEHLRALRRRDADAARELTRRRFPSEPAAERLVLVEACAVGLDAADEPFLEAALDDRAATVRQAALALLDRLPTSRRASRMAARLAPLVRLRGRLRPTLEVDWPAEPDAAAARDGVTSAGPRGRGRQAWWLQQLVAAAPLGTWEARLERDPATIVALGADRAELVDGWVAAAVAQRDARWAEALFPVRPQPALLAVVPPAMAEAAATTWLGARPNLVALSAVLVHLPRPWSGPFSDRLVARLAGLGKEIGPQLHGLAPALASGLDPAVAPALVRWSTELGEHDSLRRQVRGVHHALSLRQTIAEELGGAIDA
jgi:hypothetical protein